MRHFNIKSILRDNIRRLQPYASARTEFTGEASLFLDANENAVGGAAGDTYRRYPDPLQQELKRKIAALREVPEASVFLGNGSDEPIDLLIRAVCTPGRHNIVLFPPTYGMYEVLADIQGVAVRKVPMNEDFSLDAEKVRNAPDQDTRIVFFCSPNNPTGNLLERDVILRTLETFPGIVVVDEAYIDFSADASWLGCLNEYPNLVVLQTFSKAWGMAGLRLGAAYADPELIGILNAIKLPYNISTLVQEAAMHALAQESRVESWIGILCSERERLVPALAALPFVRKVFPSEANFLLVEMEDADKVYRYLAENGIVVRNRSRLPLCADCLRITVGTAAENNSLIQALQSYKS